MNIFNRIFTIISLVLLVILGSATLLIPDRMIQLINGIADTIHVVILGGMSDPARFLVRAVTALVLVVVILLLLWFEFRRSGSRHVDVAKVQGGRIRIHTSDVEARLQQQVDAISGVISSRVRISERNNAVVSSLDVMAAPGTDLTAIGTRVIEVTGDVVEKQLGLKLFKKPEIKIKTSNVKTVPATASKQPAAVKSTPPVEKT